MLKVIYQHLKSHLATITDVEAVDYYLGQDEQDDAGSVLYTTPSLFIEFLEVPWMQLGKQVQRATLNFIIHTVTDSIYDDEDRILDPAFDHLALVNEVYKKLQGHRYKDGDFVIMETIERVSTTPDHSLNVIIKTSQEFRCTIFDYEAYPITQTTQIDTITITPTIDVT